MSMVRSAEFVRLTMFAGWRTFAHQSCGTSTGMEHVPSLLNAGTPHLRIGDGSMAWLLSLTAAESMAKCFGLNVVMRCSSTPLLEGFGPNQLQLSRVTTGTTYMLTRCTCTHLSVPLVLQGVARPTSKDELCSIPLVRKASTYSVQIAISMLHRKGLLISA